jgi:hypothetical protein
MMSRRMLSGLLAVSIGTIVAACNGPAVAAPPAAPKVSSFAPAEDLVSQTDEYVKDLTEAVASEQDFKDAQEKVTKQSNTLILMALALGLHDTDNKYKAAAPALFKAAGQLAAAKDYASAQAGVAAVKAALESKTGGGELKWEKAASLEQLMKQVPLVNTKLKRFLKGPRFIKSAKETAGYTAVLATIAQGAMADTGKAKNPAEVQQWYQFSGQMRDHAAELNAAIHAKDRDASEKAMKKLAQSCDDCHTVFHKAALGK